MEETELLKTSIMQLKNKLADIALTYQNIHCGKANKEQRNALTEIELLIKVLEILGR